MKKKKIEVKERLMTSCKAAECEEDEETVLYEGVNGASSLVLAVNWIFLCRLSIRPLLPAKHSLYGSSASELKKTRKYT